MLKDITLGQYFPGNTFIHRLDPRTKLIYTLLYMICLFIVQGPVGYGLAILVFAAEVIISKVSLKTMFKGLKPLTFIIVFTALINIFYNKDGKELLSFWIFTVTDAGIIKAIQMVIRIMLLVLSSFLLTYTTTPMALTDGIETLLSPLKKLHVPVHEFAMMMSIALRFIPTLVEEADRIMNAQKARGADFETGSLIDRAKALLPLLIPLFVSAFRRADELAIAMEARCYQGGEGRTRMKKLKMTGRDYGSLAFSFLFMAGCILITRFSL